MADNRQYYYMRLKDDFFDNLKMKLLEAMPDGYLYSNILLKMYLISLKGQGRMMLNNIIPYNATMIATVTGHQVGTVEKALEVFKQLELIEILDNGAIYMLNIQNYIGKSSTEADRKKDYRKRIEEEKLLLGINEGQMSDKCPDKCPQRIEYRDKSIENRDKSIENKNIKTIEINNNTPLYPPTGEKAKRISVTSLVKDRKFPEKVEAIVLEWLKYKNEKHQMYKETGLRNFLSQVQKNVDAYGIENVVEVFRQSMAMNYQGVVWDKCKVKKSDSNPNIKSDLSFLDEWGE